jgi:hypothetical protein
LLLLEIVVCFGSVRGQVWSESDHKVGRSPKKKTETRRFDARSPIDADADADADAVADEIKKPAPLSFLPPFTLSNDSLTERTTWPYDHQSTELVHAALKARAPQLSAHH